MVLSEELKWRGFINQTTFEDISILDNQKISFYIGVDPSADSMTIGNLAAIMMVHHFIAGGHKAYLLIGGATGLIGDPDGKESERNLKSFDEISKNKINITSQYKQLLKDQDFVLVDNYDWFKNINYLDFLRDVGKHVPMSQMMSRDFIAKRLGSDGSGISYAEFSYALIQGYDFLHLFREYGVTLQLCGSDQWGNAVAGVDLIRRIEGQEAHIYTTPLIVNKTTGVKFGKSEAGAVWLDSRKTSVYNFYQFWLNLDDSGVIDYLKIFTLLDKNSIENIELRFKQNPGERLAQKTLAKEATQLVHGQERTDSAIRVTDVLFGDALIDTLKPEDIELLSNEIPTCNLGVNLVEVLVKTGLSKSNGEARRLISSGAVKLNSRKIYEDVRIDKISLIKKGKNNYTLVK
ncbi:MAG: tyrosine--tRNA ligase [Candidatus Saccharimonadales bacterium]